MRYVFKSHSHFTMIYVTLYVSIGFYIFIYIPIFTFSTFLIVTAFSTNPQNKPLMNPLFLQQPRWQAEEYQTHKQGVE